MLQKERLFSKKDIVLIARYVVNNPEYMGYTNFGIVYPDEVFSYVARSGLTKSSDILNPTESLILKNYIELSYISYEEKFSLENIARILYNLLAHFTNDAGHSANLSLDQIVYRLNTDDLDYLTRDNITQRKIIEDSINCNLSNLFLLFAIKKGVIKKDNISDLFSSSWHTPILNWAMYVGLDIDIFKSLIHAGAPYDSKSGYPQGIAPLHLACYKGLFAHVKVLTGCGANLNAQDTEFGDTPLIKAVIKNHLDIIAHLTAMGAEVDKTNKVGSTPMNCAASNGLTSAAAILIAAGADVNLSNGGPLKSAVRSGKEDVARLLIRCGAKVNQAHLDSIKYDDKGTIKELLTTTYNEQHRSLMTQVSVSSEVTGRMLEAVNTHQVVGPTIVHN